MEFLPEELLLNILFRLSIKDIFRYKLVCKSWLRLISSSSDTYFRIIYARYSPFTLIFRATFNYLDDPDKLSFSMLEFAKKGGGGGGGGYTQIPLLTPQIPDHQGSDSHLSFIGSCNCSIFILHHKPFNDHVIHRVYSYNPAVLGSCVVKLVAEDIIGKWERRQYRVGFIPSNSTYKLLRFYHSWKKAEKAEIFTVGGLDENWRKVDDDHPLTYEGLFCLDGSYHWLARKKDGVVKIFTFNLLEEKMGTVIPTPHGVSRLSRVTILNGRLSLVDRFKDGNKNTIVIWAMKEYGVVESWSKVAVLRLRVYRDDLKEWRHCYLVPIAVLANGYILFADKHSKGMCFYNRKEKRFTQIEPPDSSPFFRRYEITYVPRFYT